MQDSLTGVNMKAFKGFDKDMRCRGFQYEEGKSYEEPTAKLCSSGFHACENPLDTLDYYPLLDEDGNPNRFAEVDLDDVTDERASDDSKRAGKKIHIKAALDLKGIISAGVDSLFESNTAEKDTEEISSDRLAKLAASGDRSKLAASGDDSVVANIGIEGQAKAAKGCWITLAEWVIDGAHYVPKAVVTKQVDGEIVKAGAWYKLQGGEFVEVE